MTFWKHIFQIIPGKHSPEVNMNHKRKNKQTNIYTCNSDNNLVNQAFSRNKGRRIKHKPEIDLIVSEFDGWRISKDTRPSAEPTANPTRDNSRLL